MAFFITKRFKSTSGALKFKLKKKQSTHKQGLRTACMSIRRLLVRDCTPSLLEGFHFSSLGRE
jgi:hypothetical protein